MLEKLKKEVCQANIMLFNSGLVTLTWGNVSGIDRKRGIIAIKPSGVNYGKLTPNKITLVDLEGNIVEGKYRPSSDTPTHLELYRNFEHIDGICHTHSTFATAWAQAEVAIPPLGTTHADLFFGYVPITTKIPKKMIESDYELNTGKIIVQTLKGHRDCQYFPGVLVAEHGPFTWGNSPKQAVEHAIALEEIAKITLLTKLINPQKKKISKALLAKHFFRKHGKHAYYGQPQMHNSM